METHTGGGPLTCRIVKQSPITSDTGWNWFDSFAAFNLSIWEFWKTLGVATVVVLFVGGITLLLILFSSPANFYWGYSSKIWQLILALGITIGKVVALIFAALKGKGIPAFATLIGIQLYTAICDVFFDPVSAILNIFGFIPIIGIIPDILRIIWKIKLVTTCKLEAEKKFLEWLLEFAIAFAAALDAFGDWLGSLEFKKANMNLMQTLQQYMMCFT